MLSPVQPNANPGATTANQAAKSGVVTIEKHRKCRTNSEKITQSIATVL